MDIRLINEGATLIIDDEEARVSIESTPETAQLLRKLVELNWLCGREPTLEYGKDNTRTAGMVREIIQGPWRSATDEEREGAIFEGL